MDEFQNVLQNPRSNNLLVQACNLYINRLHHLLLQCLPWFTRKVTVPLLNMCEIKKHSELLIILPQPKNDLEKVKLTTLSEYEAEYSFDVHEPLLPLGKHIVAEFCKKGAIDLTTQRGREYEFAAREQPRATEINKIPTEQLDREKDLSVFDHLAKRTVLCASQKFTGKGMRDESTLIQSDVTKIEKVTKTIAKVLDEDEKLWVKGQNILHEEKLKRDAENANHLLLYVQSLLAKCKKHGGPFISAEEVDQCLKDIKDEIEKKRILRVEILYCRHTSGSDAQQRPHLYKVNQLSLAEMKINIVILLTNSADELSDILPIPCEDEVLKMLSLDQQVAAQNECNTSETAVFEPKINKPSIVI